MEYPTQIILDWIANYFWPYVRISSMLMVMTVTGARFVSPRIRLYLGLAITFAVMPAIPAISQDIQLLSFRGFMTIAEQMIIGVAMGMVTQFMIQRLCCSGKSLVCNRAWVLRRWSILPMVRTRHCSVNYSCS